ncbi:TPA: hypothetical protein ACH3X1_003587 [Trebouxia sp. C0004]
MVSVSVCSCSSHFQGHPHKQTQQQQQQHHHHLAESASGSSRAAGQQQVNGFRAYLQDVWCSLHALLVLTLAGRLHSQRSFTANTQPTACKISVHVSIDMTVSWSCSRWQEAAGIKYRLHKTGLWIRRKPDLNDALLATPTAKVASSAQFLHHIRHRMQHTDPLWGQAAQAAALALLHKAAAGIFCHLQGNQWRQH